MDDAETNKKFAESLSLDYPILSDPSKETAEAYGVLRPNRSVANRWTFYIDKSGIIKHVDRKVETGSHGADISTRLEELGFPKSD